MRDMLKLFACRPFGQRQLPDDPGKDYKRVDFDVHRPTYFVKYLGCEDIYKPGIPEICSTVKDLYLEKKHQLKSLDHFSLTISKEEVALRDNDSTEDQETVFALRRILYCGVYSLKQTIFFYNYQSGPKGDMLTCHVVLCRNKEDAKSLAKVIGAGIRAVQHDVHREDVAYRQLHAQGLSNSSTLKDSVSNVDINRKMYYNLDFEGKPLLPHISVGRAKELSAGKSLAAKNNHVYKRRSRSDSSHLDSENRECEGTESSQDNAQHSDDTTSTDQFECDALPHDGDDCEDVTRSLITSCACTHAEGDNSEPNRDRVVRTGKAGSESTLYACSEHGSRGTLVSYDSKNGLSHGERDWGRVTELLETEI